MHAIILAGGFGTRLQSVIKDVPKPMAPINGKPFLQYLLDYLCTQNITKIIFSVFYQHETIIKYFKNNYKGLLLEYVIDEKPLGTGGAIKNALAKTNAKNIFIINGDTFLELDYKKMHAAHIQNGAKLTIAVKEIINADRYGTVKITKDNIIEKFLPPKKIKIGNINVGVYLVNVETLRSLLKNLPEKFSFENEFLTTYANTSELYAFKTKNFFIDIGIPEDYANFSSKVTIPNLHITSVQG